MYKNVHEERACQRTHILRGDFGRTYKVLEEVQDVACMRVDGEGAMVTRCVKAGKGGMRTQAKLGRGSGRGRENMHTRGENGQSSKKKR